MERLVRAFAVDLRITQFPLHPDTPAEGMTLEELFAGRDFDVTAAQVKLAELMAAEGLPYGKRTHTYNSRLAQELAKWGEEQPNGAGIHDALFRAYFVDGVNLANVERLLDIAAAVGLSRDEAERVLMERSFKGSVDRDWQRSAALGVTGVPTFVVDGRGVVGAQPYDALEEFLVQSGVPRR